MKQQGIVRWFNDRKGYGFIKSDESFEDIFVHYSAIQGEGYKTLHENQRVEFELERGIKGMQAQRVIALEPIAKKPEASDIAA